MKKTIYDAYQEIKQREISELKDAVRNAGGEVEFQEDNAPIVMVNFDGYFPHPADVRITRVKLKDDELLIDGQEKGVSGCAEWFDSDEYPIEVDDIAYGHIDFITSEIVRINKRNDVQLDLGKDAFAFGETLVEFSHLLYDKFYEKYQDSFEVMHAIYYKALSFEKELKEKGRYDDDEDYLLAIDKRAEEILKELDD